MTDITGSVTNQKAVDVSKRTCPVCDKEFEGKNNQRFCPPTEDDRKRSGPNTQPRSWCAKRYERHVSRGTPLKGQPPQPFTCRQCGKHCVQGKDGIGPNMTTYCSKRCKMAWHRKRNAPGPHCRVSSAPKPRTWRSGRCPECGEWFVCTGISKTKFCSRDCLKKTCKRRRRAMVKGVGYKTLRYSVIAERDKWTCQLCGEPIDRTAKVPHPLSPTLDHIIPLSVGGEHCEENSQMAHFICNSRKGDGTSVPIGGQTALV